MSNDDPAQLLSYLLIGAIGFVTTGLETSKGIFIHGTLWYLIPNWVYSLQISLKFHSFSRAKVLIISKYVKKQMVTQKACKPHMLYLLLILPSLIKALRQTLIQFTLAIIRLFEVKWASHRFGQVVNILTTNQNVEESFICMSVKAHRHHTYILTKVKVLPKEGSSYLTFKSH